MTQALNFTIKRLWFDENYHPSATTRNTTNFANLARGQRRQENLRRQGIPDALTGPLVRADVGTVAAHLRALGQVDKEWVELYTALARASRASMSAWARASRSAIRAS